MRKSDSVCVSERARDEREGECVCMCIRLRDSQTVRMPKSLSTVWSWLQLNQRLLQCRGKPLDRKATDKASLSIHSGVDLNHSFQPD